MDQEDGRVPAAPGSREPSPSVSAASGFDPSRWVGKAVIRCMGGRFCDHSPGTCTADPEYQRFIQWEREKLTSRAPSREEAAAEIGHLVNRILALAPHAGLYVGIKIENARIKK